MSPSVNRQEIWQEKMALARRASAFLRARVPGVRAVGLTGSVAYGDVSVGDDLDFLIITRARRVYTTRLLAYLWAIILGKKRTARDERDKWCLNLFLDETDLVIPPVKRTPFARLQLERLRVLDDPEGLFARLMAENRFWLDGESEKLEEGIPDDVQLAAVEHDPAPAGHILGDWLEVFLRRLQLAYMRPRVTREYLSDTQIFFHPRDRDSVQTERNDA